MATWQAFNVQTGTIENPKYLEIGVAAVLWRAALGTTLMTGDQVLGPVIPPGVFIDNLSVDVDQLDTGGQITFTVGTAALPAQFISTSTVAQTGGIQGANVAGTLTYSPTVNTQVIATITRNAAIPKAGFMRFKVTYTANP